MTRQDLRDELVARAARDRAHAAAFFDVVGADEELGSQLDRLLADPATPLLVVLAEWSACPVEGARLVEVVAGNARRLDEIVAEHGWPGLSLAGGDGADAAWLLAQHADLANELRAGWVEPLGAAVRAGEADPRHLASLVDRIAVVAGAPQTYGTVAALENGEVSFAHPVDAPDQLDARRAGIGLPPMADDADLLALGDIVPFGPDRHPHPGMRWP